MKQKITIWLKAFFLIYMGLNYYSLHKIQAQDIIIDWNTRYQQMDGFGAHLYNYSTATDYYPTQQFLTDYIDDLGNSIVRFELHPNFCKDSLSLSEMENYANYNMNLAGNKIDTILKALKNLVQKSPSIKVIGTVWSPPGWMKTNKVTIAGGELRPDCYEHFARYLYQYYKYIQDVYGVTLYAISPQNELRFKQYYNSCIYKPTTYHDMIKALGSYFESKSCPVLFFGPEDMTKMTDLCYSFVKAVKEDPSTSNYLDIIASHGYIDGILSAAADPSSSMAFYELCKPYEAPQWMTETSGEHYGWEEGIAFNKNGSPRQGALEGLGLKIHVAIVYGFTQGWIYWIFDQPDKLDAYTMSANSQNKKFYAHKHYSKFIRPGAFRVDATPDRQNNIWVSAYHHPTANTMTVVLLNTSTDSKTISLQIKYGMIVSSFERYQTTDTENFIKKSNLIVNTADNTVSITLPARSMTTLNGNCTLGNQGTAAVAPTISCDKSTQTSSETVYATLTINKCFGYWSTTSATGPFTRFDMNYNSGNTTIVFPETGSLWFYASDGVNSTAVSSRVFTITGDGSQVYYVPATGKLSVEAERYYSVTDGVNTYDGYKWTKKNGPYGSLIMQALPNTNVFRNPAFSSDAPKLTYKVSFPSSGTYYLWIRGSGPYKSDNWYNSTVYFGLDGVSIGYKKFTLDQSGIINVNKLPNDYVSWQKAEINVSSAGVHDLNFWMMADGFRLDNFEITKEVNYAPDKYIATFTKAPSNFSVMSKSDTNIVLKWDSIPGATGYKLYYKEAVSGSSYTLNIGKVTTYNFVKLEESSDLNLHASREYSFKIKAYNRAGDGVMSSTLLVTTNEGKSGGSIRFENATSLSASYTTAQDIDFRSGGYDWKITGCSKDVEGLGTTINYFDAALYAFSERSSVKSVDSIPGGVGNLELSIGRPLYPFGAKFAVYINGKEVGRTEQLSAQTPYNDQLRYIFPGINISGKVIIEVRNLTLANGNYSRGGLDDVIWTAYSSGAPGVPGGLSINTSTTTGNKIGLKWNAVSGATGYRIYRIANTSDTLAFEMNIYKLVGEVTSNTFVDENAGLLGEYYYAVTAYNTSGESKRCSKIFASVSKPAGWNELRFSSIPIAGNGTYTENGNTWTYSNIAIPLQADRYAMHANYVNILKNGYLKAQLPSGCDVLYIRALSTIYNFPSSLSIYVDNVKIQDVAIKKGYEGADVYIVPVYKASGELKITSNDNYVLVSDFLIEPYTGNQQPTYPTNLIATNLSETGFTLNWKASKNAVSYEVFKDGISIGTTTSLSIDISGVFVNATYFMTVKATDNQGIVSQESVPLSVTIPDTHAPSIPDNITAASISTTSFILQWADCIDNVGIALYEVYVDGNLFGTSEENTLQILNLKPNTNYSITIQAIDGAGNTSGLSTAMIVKTLVDTQAPTAPTGLYATDITPTSFSLSWTASADDIDVVSYEVFLEGVSVGTTTGTSISLDKLNAATTYVVTVKAKDAAGNLSVASTSLSVTTTTMAINNDVQQIVFYPNPASNVIQILINTNETVTLSVIDMLGRTNKIIHYISSNQTIDVSDLKTGVYMLKVETESAVSIHKMHINR